MRFLDIPPLDEKAATAARKKIDGLSKPMGSLGRLEEYAVRLAAIRGHAGGLLGKKAVLVFAADNGVHEEGITPVPQAVTASQAKAIANGLAGVSVLAKQAGADVFVFDVGMARAAEESAIIDCAVMRGTNNMAHGPAMTREQCEAAVRVGFDAVKERGEYGALGIGEMGICNTTTAAAVACALLGAGPEEMTGLGAGITDAQYRKKVDTVKKALDVNRPDGRDAIDVLAKVGGLDIAAMAGAFCACACYSIPAVADGFISICAALAAVRMDERVGQVLFLSHKSAEKGYAAIARALGLHAPMDMGMRLGEGSGCPLMFYLLEAALCITDGMGTLEAAAGIGKENLVDFAAEE
ncbi:MAG: nicotinate-nucleotide--dimethylbenzimidazole phosphoribosyltransferase [Christensenellaceae bacterium]|jgi:nicotinate-nucleotide--dimethylbenzimidazole phosphoribosyltransferase